MAWLTSEINRRTAIGIGDIDPIVYLVERRFLLALHLLERLVECAALEVLELAANIPQQRAPVKPAICNLEIRFADAAAHCGIISRCRRRKDNRPCARAVG